LQDPLTIAIAGDTRRLSEVVATETLCEPLVHEFRS
jgi:hypothetical protein